MGILLALGAGKLWSRDSPPPCPLERVDLIAAGGALLVDNQARRCAWRGRCFTCAPGIEDALCWGQRPLLLSGEADCLTLHAPDGTPEWTLHTGVEPRQLCLLPGAAAWRWRGGFPGRSGWCACRSLRPCAASRCRGRRCAWRCSGDGCMWPAPWGRRRSTACCAACPCARAGWKPCGPFRACRRPGRRAGSALYLGATERLYRFTGDPPQLGALREGFGLPRRILPLGGQVLVADPVLEQALVLDTMLQKKPVTLYRGEVQDACITSSVPGNPSP